MSLPFHKQIPSRLHPSRRASAGFHRRLFAFICSTMLILLPCGCAGDNAPANEITKPPVTSQTPAQTPDHSSAGEETFSAFLDDFFREYATSDSLSLHYTVSHPENLNIDSPAVSLGHFSAESLLESNETALRYLDRLHVFSKEALTPSEQFNYELLEYALENSVFPAEAVLYDTPLGPSTGLQTQLPVLLAEYRFTSLKDVEDYFLLLEDLPRYFSELCAFEKARADAGTQSCAEVLSRILLQCTSFVENPGSNFLIESFRDRLAVLPELTAEQTAELCIRNQTLVFSKVLPAYEQLIETLQSLLDTSVPAKGLALFPNGSAYYEYLIRSTTGSDKSIEELEKMLQKALTENMLTMFTLYESEELRKELEAYQKQGLSTETPSTILQQLQNRIQSDFPTSAETSFRVESVHPSLEDFISPAFYLIPPFDNYKENVIYINNAKCAVESLYSTLAHEGYPGHLYQNTYFASTSPHPVRMLLNFTGYDEGWGTYAELFSYKYADCSEELRRFLIAEQMAGLCVYSLSDIRIHFRGEDIDTVSAFLQKYGFSKESAEELYYTQLAEPGIYLPYSVGYLEICELRNLYTTLKGADASLLPFHTFLLETGPAPFSLLRTCLERKFQ